MKISSSIVISGVTLIVGIYFNQHFLWIPLSILIAGIIDLYTRKWVASNDIGSMISLSTTIKGVLALVGFYAMLGQLVCFGLIIKWLIN